ncbi:hypothetical protein EG327_005224 [Venturia inaequalis]|uniref:Uncharacterized protein n=1 Tax=Venturia inaequalis TaxID=5025 RepID=A0A8H3YK12_VENIN|nr:hypothetical protein EG327_005224 [Venturia inaequalis]
MTGFIHIDVNLYRVCNENIGVDAIQGSLTITGEDNKNCTRIIPKINDTSKTLEWIEIITKRGVKIGKGFITGMKPDVHWTAAEVKAFDTNWTDIIYQDLQVRVTHSLIPYGSNRPATRERITMLLWLCGIQEDHKTLEIAKGVHYNLSNPVAATLVGRTKWSCGSVATEAHKIITNNKYSREAYKVQEDKVVVTFAPKFREMIVLERHIFGKNSFFNVMYNTRTTDSIRPEPTMDEGNNKGQDLNDI